MGMNQHESHLATSYQDDTANQFYQHTFKGRMGMNRHKLYTRSILPLYFIFRDSNCSHEGGSKSVISNQEVTITVPNKRAVSSFVVLV